MISSRWLIDGRHPIVDHVSFVQEAKRNFAPTANWEGRVGRIMWPSGPTPGGVGLLVHRSVLDAMDLNASHSVTFSVGQDEVTIGPLVISEPPMCVFGGVYNDPKSVYYVRFSDRIRWFALNPFFGSYTIRQFNVRCPNGGPYEYYPATVPGGILDQTPYTWQQVLDNLWSDCFPGEYNTSSPTLPFTPDQSPENLRFEGVPAWSAYNEVLRRLCCAFAVTPTLSPYIVQVSESSTAYTASLDRHRTRLLLDGEYQRIYLGKVPKYVVTLFHKVSTDYGTEDTTSPTNEWSMDAIHRVTVESSSRFTDPADIAAFSSKVWDDSYTYVWDDMRATVSPSSGAVINDDDLTQRAEARADDVLRVTYSHGNKSYKTYQGVINESGFLPNGQVTAVAWIDDDAYGHGPRTEIVDSPLMFSIAAEKDEWVELYGHDFRESFRPPDFSRQKFPNYPVHLQLVRVDSATPDPDTGLYAGTLVYALPDSGVVISKESCWVYDPNS